MLTSVQSLKNNRWRLARESLNVLNGFIDAWSGHHANVATKGHGINIRVDDMLVANFTF